MTLGVILILLLLASLLFIKKITLLFFLLIAALITTFYIAYGYLKTMDGDEEIWWLFMTAEFAGHIVGILLLLTAIVGYYWFKFL